MLTLTSSFTSAETLHARVVSTLDLLLGNIDLIRKAPDEDSAADKAACEIALLCWVLTRRDAHPQVRDRVARLLDPLEQRLCGEPIARAILWKPSLVAMLSMGAGLLGRLGRSGGRARAAAEIAWCTNFAESREESPLQALETEWSRNIFMSGSSARLTTPQDFALERRFAPMMNAEDAYAFTHAIFYLTDFGALIPSRDLRQESVWRTIDSGVVWSLTRYDFDLLGEFLLCALFTDSPTTAVVRLGIASLLATWGDLSFVPDRNIAIGSSREVVFMATYHANLVAALLANEMILRGINISDPDATGSRPAGSPGKLLERILGTSVADRVARELPAALLADVLPDLVIARAFANQELEAVIAGIRLAASSGRPLSATAECASEWLKMLDELRRPADTSPSSAAASA
jgi:hypothetical protein